ncbi:peptidylprolyl isomerase [Pseudobdellovibrio exovorus]|uniref:PpiC domain-containing protein n=1 Tax=Pseudobdellovibrio exovorus JSS TaxID=1184267 RepID=M4V7S4_9BACT|nr:peptidylprolyl isomerase [Pseudobdellovibrio exovorus]AGH95273.1 hypothetical protein A11Q_1057 [Pseudobdellovibrio exovorus JSS]
MKETYHAAHILLPTRHEAEDILRKLAEGKSFEELARKYSSCSSSKSSGDLGPIPFGKADPDFEEAVLLLKPEQVSKTPLKTRFGFHIIKRLK